MFDRMVNRAYIALAWVSAFVVMLIVFSYSNSQVDKMANEIQRTEKYLAAERWDLAQESIDKLDRYWDNGRVPALINTGNEEIGRVDELMSRVTVMSKYKDKNIVQDLAALKQRIQYINQIFSGS